jgi:hypothetical protein
MAELIGIEVIDGQLSVVIQHFFKVRKEPPFIGGITSLAPAARLSPL